MEFNVAAGIFHPFATTTTSKTGRLKKNAKQNTFIENLHIVLSHLIK